jgi:hypothetical protein
MPRDQEQKHFALVKHLRECGVEPSTFNIGPERHPEFLRQRDLTTAFSTGWDDAQKWEATEAQRQGIAVQAMNGMLASDGNDGAHFQSKEAIARQAYQMADAMMKAAKEGVSEPDGEYTTDLRRKGGMDV